MPTLDTVTIPPAIAACLHPRLRLASSDTWLTVKACSMAFEAKRYSVRYGEQGGRTHARRQYAKVVGAIPGNRITLPRTSVSGVSGIVRVVRDHEHIHISHDVWALEAANDEVVAFDWNVTGVTGVAYASYGWVLLSKTTTTKAREELRPLVKRAAGSKRVRHDLTTKQQRTHRRHAKIP
ncbi:MAG: hypothetical protein ACYCTG_14095, partial [Ferrimicrobium sp.]